MKKAILLLGFLAGCAPGLSVTRVDGLAAYTVAPRKLADAAETVKRYEFETAPEWKALDGRGSLARIELRSALAHGSEQEVAELTKELNDVASRVDMDHLGGIFSVFRTPTVIATYEKALAPYKLTTDLKWVSVKGVLVVAARFLSSAVMNGNEKELVDARTKFDAAFGNVQETVSSLLSAAKKAEACPHVRCPNNTTCEYKWHNVGCYPADYDKTGNTVKPEHVETYTDATGQVHPGGYGTGDALNKGPVTRGAAK